MASKIRSLRPLLPLQRPTPSSMPKLSCSRPYHSHDHPPPPPPFTPTESLILSSAAPYIRTHGFTSTALSLGAKEAGYIDASTNLFPRGAFSLVLWHLYTQRSALKTSTVLDDLKEQGGGKPIGVGQKVKALTWERLLGNQDVVGRWQEALALMALPANIPPSLSELHALSDEIWYLSGDISVDTSWYTKRASLSSIYAATELFMTMDRSEGFKDTREFLDRRMGDVQVVGSALGGFGQWVGYTMGSGINVLRSKGVRV